MGWVLGVGLIGFRSGFVLVWVWILGRRMYECLGGFQVACTFIYGFGVFYLDVLDGKMDGYGIAFGNGVCTR